MDVGGSGRVESTDRMTATPDDAARTAPATTSLPAMAVARTEPQWTDDMPIFMAPAWLGSQGAEFGWLEARPTPDLRIAVPFVGRRRVGLRWLQFQWGVWSNAPIDLETERAFLEGAVLQCRADGFDFITQPATMALFRTAPAGAASAPFGTVLVDLSVTRGRTAGRTHRAEPRHHPQSAVPRRLHRMGIPPC